MGVAFNSKQIKLEHLLGGLERNAFGRCKVESVKTRVGTCERCTFEPDYWYRGYLVTQYQLVALEVPKAYCSKYGVDRPNPRGKEGFHEFPFPFPFPFRVLFSSFFPTGF